MPHEPVLLDRREPLAAHVGAPEPSPRSPVRRGRTLGVVAVAAGSVEWVGSGPDGALKSAGAVPSVASPEAWADAAVEAARAADCGPGPITLLFGGSLGQERVVELPPLPRRDLVRVLERRAQQWLGEPALFGAVPLTAVAGGAQQRWLLLALPKLAVTALHRALEARGFVIQRAVPACVAHQHTALSVLDPALESSAVVTVEPEHVVVSLFVGRALHQQTVLPGNLVESNMLGAALVHELRTLDAQWRKEHQGAQVAQIAVLGLSGHRGRALCSALATVMPAAKSVRFPDAAESTESARASLLAAALQAPPFPFDLYEPPSRRAVFVGIGASLVVLGALAGGRLGGNFATRAAELDAETARLVASTNDLERLRAARASIASAVLRVDQGLARADAAHAVGFELTPCLVGLERAFGPGFVLGEHRLDADGLRVAGIYSGGAVAGLRALASAAARLDVEPWLTAPQIVPLRQSGEEGDRVLPFELRARWRRGG